jgi:hypothetical protein
MKKVLFLPFFVLCILLLSTEAAPSTSPMMSMDSGLSSAFAASPSNLLPAEPTANVGPTVSPSAIAIDDHMTLANHVRVPGVLRRVFYPQSPISVDNNLTIADSLNGNANLYVQPSNRVPEVLPRVCDGNLAGAFTTTTSNCGPSWIPLLC